MVITIIELNINRLNVADMPKSVKDSLDKIGNERRKFATIYAVAGEVVERKIRELIAAKLTAKERWDYKITTEYCENMDYHEIVVKFGSERQAGFLPEKVMFVHDNLSMEISEWLQSEEYREAFAEELTLRS